MSGFKREGRYIVVKPDCEDSIRTERLRNYIDEMCFNTPDCVVVEADWPEYELVWRMIERRVMGLPDEITAAQSELSALREENERLKSESFEELYNAVIDDRDAMREELAEIKVAAANVIVEGDALQQRLTAAEQRNEALVKLLRDIEATMDAQEDSVSLGYDVECRMADVLRPSESGASE